MKRLTRMLAVAVLAAGTLAVGTAGASAADAERAGARALANCDSWTDFRYGSTSYIVHIPSVGRQTQQTNCTLGVGNQGPAVFVLQDALRRCYGQSIALDAIYGSQTAGAVRNVQTLHGISVDGVYGSQTRTNMAWPKFTSGGTYVGCWF